MDSEYSDVIRANIELHTKLSSHYNSCEPHFRIENIAKVESRLQWALSKSKGEKMLDLGCGTGFMINIAKKYLKEITGVDVTQAMLEQVDKTGTAVITLVNHDSGTYPARENHFDIVSGYSFLHHLYDLQPTLETAFRALKKGGVFYADLDPNYYFWEAISSLERHGSYHPLLTREIEMVAYKDEDIEKQFGVERDTFNKAEYGKNIKGGFREEELKERLKEAGFSEVNIFYHWYLGQAHIINNLDQIPREVRFEHAETMDLVLQMSLPVSRHLYKYLGFYAIK